MHMFYHSACSSYTNCLRILKVLFSDFFTRKVQTHLRLFPYNTVHKGTDECHKIDESSTHFAVHISPSIFLNILNYPTIPIML